MATVPDCSDLPGLKVAATCFMPKCMGDGDREAIDLYLMMVWAAGAGGTDYTTNPSALEVDTKQWQQMSSGERKAVSTYIRSQWAQLTGGYIPGGDSASNLKSLSACLQCFGSEQRKAMMLYLQCIILGLESDIEVIGGEGGDIIGGEGGGMIGVE